jgi:hypothetical protein
MRCVLAERSASWIDVAVTSLMRLGGVGPHNPSSDAPSAESDAGSFPDANFFPDSGTIGPTMDAL